jgi:hypothetical protein
LPSFSSRSNVDSWTARADVEHEAHERVELILFERDLDGVVHRRGCGLCVVAEDFERARCLVTPWRNSALSEPSQFPVCTRCP